MEQNKINDESKRNPTERSEGADQPLLGEVTAREHTWHECNCNNDGCIYCDGGLSSCDVCGSFEGATTTHCPGRDMTEEERDDVYKGYIDYKNGQWVKTPSKFSPAYWHDRRNWDNKNPEYIEGHTYERKRAVI